ncbi:MAG: Hypothetical protein AJITA_00783 [Acetilactobacillus jinshanensis]
MIKMMKKYFTTAKKARAYLEHYISEFTIEDLRSMKASTVINLANADKQASKEAESWGL